MSLIQFIIGARPSLSAASLADSAVARFCCWMNGSGGTEKA